MRKHERQTVQRLALVASKILAHSSSTSTAYPLDFRSRLQEALERIEGLLEHHESGATIVLSKAQISAMECRDWSEEPITRRCWHGAAILVPADAELANELLGDIIEASNAEDAQADDARHRRDGTCAKYAGRAARSLAAIATGITREMQRREAAEEPGKNFGG